MSATRVLATKRPVLVGIRREDTTRIWERRAPLTPDAVNKLVSTGNVDVEVVSCNKRVFRDVEYEKAGAKLVESLSKPNFILGVKEPPLSELENAPPAEGNQTHLMFSHTVKGQHYNMRLLSHFLKKQREIYPTLIDYELLKNEDGKRTVGFGWFAGAAGVLEAFSALAQSYLEKGIALPFLYVSRPYTHPTLDDMRKTLRNVGSMIQSQGLPETIGPFVIGVTGTGNVTQGALDVLKELPITMIRPEELDALLRNPSYNKHTVYLVHAKPEDYFVRSEGAYSRADYYDNPQLYRSVFHEKIAPYLSLFINGAGWAPTFPRLMTTRQLSKALVKAALIPGHRFTNIADISCDVEGGLQFLSKATTLSAPFYDIMTPNLPPVRMMSVDILPASMPLDASKHFSSALEPYLSGLIQEFMIGESGPHSEALKRATIAEKGELTRTHNWLFPAVQTYLTFDTLKRVPKVGGLEKIPLHEVRDLVQSTMGLEGRPIQTAEPPEQPLEKSNLGPPWKRYNERRRKQVLLLGSGMVAQPAVDYLVAHYKAKLVIASNNASELEKLVYPWPESAETVLMDFGEPVKMEPLIREADVVISLLPANMHHRVAGICIKAGKPLVTASYMSPEMTKLDKWAKERNVLILTEMGLDPGLDHLTAARLLDGLRDKQVTSFVSMCGGLPAPEDALGVPLKYKFSWRPEGVLLAALNDAVYKLDGHVRRIPGQSLLEGHWDNVPITPEFAPLEGLPNRDSLSYSNLYGLRGFRTFVRGTLRYPGYSDLLASFRKLGLLNNTRMIRLEGWNTLVTQSMKVQFRSVDDVLPPLPTVIAQPRLDALQHALEWLGLAQPSLALQHKSTVPPLPLGAQTPLSIFAYLLSEKLKYARGEKDMVVLSHEIISKDRTGWAPQQVHTSTLITYGTDVMNSGFKGERPASAMARTVGLPAAIAAAMIAEGKIKLTGVHRPLMREVYQPVLAMLEEMGIVMKESTKERASSAPFNVFLRRLREKPEESRPETVEAALIDGQSIRRYINANVRQKRDLDSDPGWKDGEGVAWPPILKK